MPDSSNSPVRRRQSRADGSRTEILDAALRLMSAQGYDATSISDLARESGLPPGSIYWHFGSKEGVLVAAMQRGAEAFFAAIPSSEVLLAVPPRERLGLGLQAGAAAAAAHPEFLRLYIRMVATAPETKGLEVPREIRVRGQRRLLELLELTFADRPPEEARRIAVRMHHLGEAMLEGAFLVAQWDSEPEYAELMGVAADALLALGEHMLAVGV